ncbi:COX15/CtaA family protein [Botrimarina hoheduenensis]|uniref:Heme A synthase n=1 Tax=Botrimarina hoheduenensis TaxID=2528000 RepID=A0A5C5VXK6_9BACT|nr:COX15/CtaA family protein [Botrimarina hoheduenensis]TWT42867.1 Heme A synthase [Botrimarina hoheduenensis]
MKQAAAESPWPYRGAWLLCGLTFPLIWVGGLITTTDAGMAVPDWPGTYGYNLLLYPWQTWFFGPWDLFIEHGHRLLASLVGLLTIALLVIVRRSGEPRQVVRLAWIALGLVCLQGALGGFRVLLNARYLALVHGATGPLFFAVTVLLVAATRPTPARLLPATRSQRAPTLSQRGWLIAILPALVYTQLILGATLRHTPESSGAWAFALHVQAHLAMAAVVAVVALVVAFSEARAGRGRVAALLAAVLVGQISLGLATWVAKYRYPHWADPTTTLTAAAENAPLELPRLRGWAERMAPGTIQPPTAGGFTETTIVTAHSAIGSLLLALAVGRAAGLGVSTGRAGKSPPDGQDALAEAVRASETQASGPPQPPRRESSLLA